MRWPDRVVWFTLPAWVAASLLILPPAHADDLTDGIAALKAEHLVEAEQLLRAAAKDHPTDPAAYQWLVKLYEQTMDPKALSEAMAQVERLKRSQAKPHTAPKKPAHAAKPRGTSIRLDASTMPKPVDETRDLGPLTPLTRDPAQAGHPDSATGNALSGASQGWRQVKLKQLEASVAGLQQAIAGLQAKLGTYGQAPSKLKTMNDALQEKLRQQTSSLKSLKQELGESP